MLSLAHRTFHRSHGRLYCRLLLIGIFLPSLLLIFNYGSIRADSGAQLVFNPTTANVGVGNTTIISIDLNSISNFYGYQFRVNYDAAKVSAVGAFVNTFLDTGGGNAFVPGGWNASCAAGVCQFAATRLNPLTSLTGSGTLAQITFTGLVPGTVPLTLSSDILGDRDGAVIPHTSGTATLTVYGFATVNGTVTLQGRATPITSGTVTFTDSSSTFAPTVVNFSATDGTFSANVPALGAGTTYALDAAHSLYLTNNLSALSVAPGGTYSAGTTMLHAGDSNNDSLVDILDLSCVGGGYDTAGTVCGTTGNSDLNADGVVNIFDLVLVGGNYGLASPQPW